MNNKKVLLVLGASSDLGVELIKNVEMNYDKIIFHYRSMSEKIKKLQEKYSKKLLCIKADFCNENEYEKIIKEINDNQLVPTAIVHFASSNAEQVRFHKQNWESFQHSEIARYFIEIVLFRFSGKLFL